MVNKSKNIEVNERIKPKIIDTAMIRRPEAIPPSLNAI